jgi:Chloroplast import apparatus Tic20-like
MAWRATATEKDRFWAALTYLWPLIMAAPLSFGVLGLLLPQIAGTLFLLRVLIGQIPFLSLVIFFALYLLVVRNSRISYFIRYNTMQALLLQIAIVLYLLFRDLLGQIPGVGLLFQVTDNLMFFGAIGVIGYGIVQCFRGVYPELRVLSDAVKSHLG